MPRVVLDTVVFVRALINPYSVCGRAVFEHFDKFRLVVSRPVLVEMLEVLHREELTAKFRSLPGLDLARVLGILGRADVVEVPSVPRISRDPKDDIFLATAKAAGAGLLVSEDRDLLDLGMHEDGRIFSCSEFLNWLAG